MSAVAVVVVVATTFGMAVRELMIGRLAVVVLPLFEQSMVMRYELLLRNYLIANIDPCARVASFGGCRRFDSQAKA